MAFEKYWEMKKKNPVSKKEAEIFKCTGCGAETEHPDGHNGEPDVHRCTAACRHSSGDWKPGANSLAYKRGIERMFPNAPGADFPI